jgi:protein-tyrosine-phosphatase
MFIAARNPTKIQHAKSVSFASALVRTGNSTKSNRDELVRYLDWMGRPRPKDWELDDPTGKPIDQIRPFLEEIDRRVRALLEELVPAVR